jgi:hypothetical protein
VVEGVINLGNLNNPESVIMSPAWLRCATLSIALSVAVGWVVHSCADPDLVETPGEKSEWSVLQAIELRERDSALSEPVIRTVGEHEVHEVLGVRSDTGQNIWILLKPKAPPFYKQMPEGTYELPATLVDGMEREHRLSYTVAHVLRSHVRKQK